MEYDRAVDYVCRWQTAITAPDPAGFAERPEYFASAL